MTMITEKKEEVKTLLPLPTVTAPTSDNVVPYDDRAAALLDSLRSWSSLDLLRDLTEEQAALMRDPAFRVSISNGNRKMGAVPSVSLPACVSCRNDAPCFKECYARRMASYRKTVKTAYDRNWEILNACPAAYWIEVDAAVRKSLSFRFHVSGDIPSIEYFYNVIGCAFRNPHCEILIFTKQYEIVNSVTESINGELPANLHVMFSGWGEDWNATIPNPYRFPVVDVIFTPEHAKDFDKVCGGNCSECRCKGTGCWSLKPGEKLGIYKH